MTFWKWSQTAASNANSDATINWAEGQSPGSVNNSARAMMAASAKHRDDISNAGSTAGTASAYTLSTQQSLGVLTNRFQVSFVAHESNGAGATINIDGLGAKPLATASRAAIGAGVLAQGGLYTISYDSGEDEWLVHNVFVDPSPAPVGAVMDYTGATAPSGWFLANGSTASRTTYADLFALIGTIYGAGDGSTTFHLPDYRGRVLAGSDDMGSGAALRLTGTTMSGNGQALGETGGTQTHALGTGELPSHSHSVNINSTSAGSHNHAITDPTHTHLIPSAGNILIQSGGTGVAGTTNGNQVPSSNTYAFINPSTAVVAASTGISIQNNGSHAHNVSGNTGSAGSGSAHLNIQPTIVTYKIIKF